MNREEIIQKAINEVVYENKGIERDPIALINKSWQRKAEYETDMFPSYCRHAYEVNFKAQKALYEIGKKGRFTDSYGWSKDRTFLAKWVIPSELKHYMKNMVYVNFWDDSNAKVRDSFMKAVCRGGTLQDYKDLLSKVVLYYGAESGKFITERFTK
ncbi:MAG: hypothetical protein LLG05_03510 [Porphyromonadaceae bacterium]|nr:hypothetical protein [Porphyromonadaceae bacterium]